VQRFVVAAFGAGGVAVEAVEDFGGGVVEGGVEAVDHEVGFEGAGALQIPGRVGEVVEGEVFHSALRGQFIEQGLPELFEGGALIVADGVAAMARALNHTASSNPSPTGVTNVLHRVAPGARQHGVTNVFSGL